MLTRAFLPLLNMPQISYTNRRIIHIQNPIKAAIIVIVNINLMHNTTRSALLVLLLRQIIRPLLLNCAIPKRIEMLVQISEQTRPHIAQKQTLIPIIRHKRKLLLRLRIINVLENHLLTSILI